MKNAIEQLLRAVESGATFTTIVHHAWLVRQAFDAGDFDYPVEHSPDEPPDTARDVLCLTGYKFPGAELRWRVSCFKGYWKCGNNNIHVWCELPPGAYTEK